MNFFHFFDFCFTNQDYQNETKYQEEEDQHIERNDLYHNKNYQEYEEELPFDENDLIFEQIEFYFSNSNLESDYSIRKLISSSKNGFVPISYFVGLPRMIKLNATISIIQSSVIRSPNLVIDRSGLFVARKIPFKHDPSRYKRLVSFSSLDQSDDLDFIKNLLIVQFPSIQRISMKRVNRDFERVFTGDIVVEFGDLKETQNAISLGFEYKGRQIFGVSVQQKINYYNSFNRKPKRKSN